LTATGAFIFQISCPSFKLEAQPTKPSLLKGFQTKKDKTTTSLPVLHLREIFSVFNFLSTS